MPSWTQNVSKLGQWVPHHLTAPHLNQAVALFTWLISRLATEPFLGRIIANDVIYKSSGNALPYQNLRYKRYKNIVVAKKRDDAKNVKFQPNHHHHHHHVVPLARISLTLSSHLYLSFIASGRTSGLHPVSSQSCCMYVRAGRPAFAQPYVGAHRSTSLMSSSLLLLHVWFV